MIGFTTVVIAQLFGGAIWSIPLLKGTLVAGFLAGLDKFKNVMRESEVFGDIFRK